MQKDKQRSTKHTHKTKDPVTRTPLNTGSELKCSGRVSVFHFNTILLAGHFYQSNYQPIQYYFLENHENCFQVK